MRTPVSIYLKDYKRVDGLLIPHNIQAFPEGGGSEDVTITSVEHNVEMAADRFDLPPEIKDLLK